MKVLLLGGGGQVARALAACTPAGHRLNVLTRNDLDIRNESAVERVLAESGAAWVVNGAAYTAVDRAETEPNLAREINATAVGIVARAAARAGARLLHLSTDFVFDGQANRAYLPSDHTHPLSVYGSTKREGEVLVLEHGSEAVIVRTAWVYAASGRNFALTMLRLMREKQEVRVVADQIGTPTWATGIGRALWGIMDAGVSSGIYHWTDSGVASWYDFAVAIQDEARAVGLLERTVPIVPIGTSEYPTSARRPAFSVLDCQTTRALIAAPARHWRHNLRDMLDELRAS